MTFAPQVVPPLSDVNTPIPAVSISDDQIDAHIPAGVPRNDRIVLRKVMAMLPAGERESIVWFRVQPGRSGYERLPNHGLVVEYIAGVADYRKRVGLPMDFDGEFVLYFNDRVQPDSNVIFSRRLDRYLTAVPQGVHILHRR
ncbi:MAG TPA: hypothetical protein VN934_04700 [Candidatus Tumulicola sp.]|nr:hypothetical protein [Candidatus Tumulicola sp.]